MKVLIVDNTELIAKDNDFCLESRAAEFKLELKNYGNTVAVFGQKLKPREDSVHVFGLQAHGIEVKGLWRKKNKMLNYLALYTYAFFQIPNFDFVYIFYSGSFRYFAYFCKFLNIPFGIYIRGIDDLDDRVSKSIYKKASIIYTVSDLFTNNVNTYLGIKKAKTIRPMIPYSEHDIVENREYNEKNTYKIIYFGRLAAEKGVKELLVAVKMLSEIRTNFVVDIVGNGEYFEETKQLIEELSLSKIVALKGPEYDIDKIKEIYLEADIFVLPTYYEGFPRTIYEAMIFGTPVITTMVGGIPQLMKDKVNCLEIKVQSVESIVEVVNTVLNNYSLVKPIAQNSTQTIKTLLTTRNKSHALDLHTDLQTLIDKKRR